MSRKIACFTATRAEYGILRWVLTDILADPALDLALVVSGTHLEQSHGTTIGEIADDGIPIALELPLGISGDSPKDVAAWMANCLVQLTDALIELAPDILLMVGDRYETLIAAQAAQLAGTPVAHVHGGELTLGAADDSLRHAVTKMAHLHFAANYEYAQRIIQLGESPSRVFAVGAPGLCELDRGEAREEVSDEVAAVATGTAGLICLTYHPATEDSTEMPDKTAHEIVSALRHFPNFAILITGVNTDPGSESIGQVFGEFANAHKDRVVMTPSLGHRDYLAALRKSAVCLGNSSSGIVEAPALGIPTVNVGSRQAGRLRAASVVDVGPHRTEIQRGIELALSDEFGSRTRAMDTPYQASDASRRIVDILRRIDLTSIRMKRFYDLPGLAERTFVCQEESNEF